MHIDLDEIDLNDYYFTYFTEDLIQRAFKQHTTETGKKYSIYNRYKWILQYIKSVVMIGFRKYGEEEQQWNQLKHEMENLIFEYEKEGEGKVEKILKKAYICYDLALILSHEGFTLPNM